MYLMIGAHRDIVFRFWDSKIPIPGAHNKQDSPRGALVQYLKDNYGPIQLLSCTPRGEDECHVIVQVVQRNHNRSDSIVHESAVVKVKIYASSSSSDRERSNTTTNNNNNNNSTKNKNNNHFQNDEEVSILQELDGRYHTIHLLNWFGLPNYASVLVFPFVQSIASSSAISSNSPPIVRKLMFQLLQVMNA